MDQLIKLNNKNNFKKNDNNPLKISFQRGILKYVERKKKELSGFSTINGKLKIFEDKFITADSNLMGKNTQTNFYQSRKLTDPQFCPNNNFGFIDRKPKLSFNKRQAKGHKSTLSDWRDLYCYREQIVTNKQRSEIFDDQMNVTDRLFYSAKKMVTPEFQNEEIKRASCKQINQTQKIDRLKKIKYNQQQPKEQKLFVNDQNFYHLFYKSKTPFLFKDQEQNKRVEKYLKENKHRRHQSLYGLGQLIDRFKDEFYDDESYLKNVKNKSMLEKELNVRLITVNNFRPKSKKIAAKKVKQEQQNIMVIDSQRQEQYSKDINPQKQEQKKDNSLEKKKFKNLSQILCIDLKILQNKQLNLRLFKPRKNKIQMAKSNHKSSNSQQNLSKAKSSAKNYSIRQTSTNWTTLYSNFRE